MTKIQQQELIARAGEEAVARAEICASIYRRESFFLQLR
jgi:hypothetical protein